MNTKQYTLEAVELLKQLISTPSVSREETAAANIFSDFIEKNGLSCQRIGNNLLVQGTLDSQKQTVLLNAHIDTVKPVAGWVHDPFTPTLEGDKLYGLGSNDCGGGLVSLLMTYIELQPTNIIFLASCEEEVSGKNGIESVLPLLPKIDFAIVGEPTGMQPAIAEKGLMVIDATAHGKAGHAARNEGDNAIYHALKDMEWFRTYQFSKVSELTGPVKMSVTIVNAGTLHNVVPDKCTFTVDVRVNECYTNMQVLDEIRNHVSCDVTPRSTDKNSSSIPFDHPFVKCGQALGLTCFGSPTSSDQMRIPYTSIKVGPGQSSRSHSADEYIELDEIAQGIETYVRLLDGLVF